MIVLITALLTGAVWALTQPPPVPRSSSPPVTPRPPRGIDLAVICDLLCVALSAGASLPRACEAVGEVSGAGHGMRLRRAAKALHLGSSWEEAWQGHVLSEVLAPAWSDGADPAPLLEQLARSIRANRKAIAKAASARLSVQLVLPVGLCLLPAFILVGVVPVLVSGSLRILG